MSNGWQRANHGNVFRIARGVKYGAFSIAAVVSLFYPSAVISATFESLYSFVYIWSGLLLVGSLSSLAGILTKTWVGEYVGLPGVIACLALYSIGAFADSSNFSGQRLFLGLIFVGFAASSYARRQDVAFQKRVADYEKRVRDGKPGL